MAHPSIGLRVKTEAFMIIETEAYGGWSDLASHSRHGKTVRNAPMFAEAGTVYVYFTYGMHWMLNLVCSKKEYPAAVLIRGVETISGPARVTKAFGIDKKLNIKCPKCGEGDVVEKRSKRGKPFYGCNKYPNCDFALWEKPNGEFCPECKSLLVYAAKGATKCSNKECGFKKESAE